MLKTIYHSIERGVKWEISAGKTYSEFGTYFYLLPTIQYNHPKILSNEDDDGFTIKFAWLFWEFNIDRYWGNLYKMF